MNLIEVHPNFANTNEFSREARNFLKNGYYTNAPRGTGAYPLLNQAPKYVYNSMYLQSYVLSQKNSVYLNL